MLSRSPFVLLLVAASLLTAQAPATLAPAVRTDFTPGAGNTVDANFTFQFDRGALQFREQNGTVEALVNFTARITALTGGSVKNVDQLLEFRGPQDQLTRLQTGVLLYRTTVQLVPGRYTLSIATKDVIGKSTVTSTVALDVPATPAPIA